MDSNKELKGILIDKEYLQSVSELTDEQAGKIFKAFYDYFYNGVVPQFEDAGSRIYWKSLIPSIERFAESYFKRIAGLKRVNEEKAAKKNLKENATDLERLIYSIKTSTCNEFFEHYKSNMKLWDVCEQQHLFGNLTMEQYFKSIKFS